MPGGPRWRGRTRSCSSWWTRGSRAIRWTCRATASPRARAASAASSSTLTTSSTTCSPRCGPGGDRGQAADLFARRWAARRLRRPAPPAAMAGLVTLAPMLSSPRWRSRRLSLSSASEPPPAARGVAALVAAADSAAGGQVGFGDGATARRRVQGRRHQLHRLGARAVACPLIESAASSSPRRVVTRSSR